MDKWQRGEFSNLDVTAMVNIQGAVRGARIRSHGHLVVQGSFDGDLTIEEGGFLTCQGTFAPGLVENHGLILASGLALVAPRPLGDMGRFAVAPGSLLDGAVLRPDGSQEPISSDIKDVTVDASTFCVWIEDEGRFVPVADLEAAAHDALPDDLP